ncbi:MAG: helix-turn-helix domain-containing protein [Halobacteriales archaeon]|nr:helix-turn-helix domain-containing protein [Halobacteriales archaeon]
MLQVGFRFQHGCKVNRLSIKHPEVTLAHWCNFRVEVLEVQTPPEELSEAFRRDFAALVREHGAAVPDGPMPRTVMMECYCRRKGWTMEGMFERNHALPLYPVIYRGGWEHYRLVAMEERKLQPIFTALAKRGKVEMTSKRKLTTGLLAHHFMVPANELFGDLTPKQAAALSAAVEQGYYRVPRKVRTEDIARRRKVPRTTFEEHVRKAESKIITSAAPYVAMVAGGEA